jgi:pimeloyl-ACP methyl ester carboxylesterase
VRALMAGALATMMVVTGCSGAKSNETPAEASASQEIRLPADYSGSGPGTLRNATKLPIVDRRLMRVAEVAARISYTSTSGIDGSLQTVTGSVFEPVGRPPEGGWQVIVFGHGSIGIGSDCAPSLSPTLDGSADSVRALLSLGFVLVAPDYQGLGTKTGYHPYLDATTEGYNMIDAARATRKLLPNVSDKWVAFGVSQGGQAAWAANELNAKYSSPDLDLVGSVSVSPATDISGLVDLAMAGTLTPQQSIVMVLILTSLKAEHPGLNLDDYRRGGAQKNWSLLGGCAADTPDKRLDVSKSLSPDDLRPASQAAADQLRTYLTQMSGLPRSPASAPLLVMHGDADQLVPVAWTEAAVQRACDMGDVVVSFIAVGRGHADFDPTVALEWIQKRFSGAPPDNTCTMPGGPSIRKVPQVTLPEV